MSGWIKMGVGLRRHPKVVRISSALKADRLRVVGALHAVWCVFDEHSHDGALAGYTFAVMDEEIGWRGFSAAMAAVDWLVSDDKGISVPEYEEHNGPTAKRRATETARKAESRSNAGDTRTKVQRIADDKRKKSGQVSASDADSLRAREEERREEEKIDPPDGGSVPGDAGDDGIASCPHQEIIAAYHAELPMLRRVREWSEVRQGYLRSRWRESPERRSVQWWREFFGYVRTCPVLVGEHDSRDHEGWQADLEWLVRPMNFVKVIEGKYERRAAA